tara:strand:- start:2147 stop:2776 length:630 start_codon:yes stop_codon:yes gene_type:complete
MSRKATIAWESWNAIVDEILTEDPISILESQLTEEEIEMMETVLKYSPIEPVQPKVLYTPYGLFAAESMLKPSNRWDCWFCYTSFDITNSMVKNIEEVDGVESIKVLSRYTMFIGIGKLFNSTLVKLNIEDTIAGRDDIILEVEETIEMVKSQVSEKPYWAIFISPTAEIEYIMSDTLNDEYLHDLNKFENLRDKIGGTILRSTNEEAT